MYRMHAASKDDNHSKPLKIHNTQKLAKLNGIYIMLHFTGLMIENPSGRCVHHCCCCCVVGDGLSDGRI